MFYFVCSNINLLPAYLEVVLTEAARRTGWSFQVIAGGPMPLKGGDVTTARYFQR